MPKFGLRRLRTSYKIPLARMTIGHDTMSMRRYPHSLLPMINQTLSDQYPPYDYQVSRYEFAHPLPIHPATQIAQLHDDPVLQLVRQKEKLAADLHAIRVEYQSQMKNRNVKRVRNTHPPNVHLRIVGECASAMERDPDPHFTGEYDWYSTGSNLAIVDDKWLLHVQTERGLMNQLKLSRITLKKKNKIRVKSQNDFDKITQNLSEFGNIYELRSNKHHLSVRQKRQITIIDPISSSQPASFTSDVPFVSSDFDTSSGNAISVDVQRVVNLWDTETSKPIQTSQELIFDGLWSTFAPSPDRWSCIRQFAPNIVAFMDRRSVRLFDIRKPITETDCLLTHQLERDLDDCEVVSCAEMMPNRQALVVGTSHKLFAIDLRMEKEEQRSFIKWVHQMQTRPTMLTISDGPEGELIFVSGQLSGDIRLCETKNLSDNLFTSPYLPACPKTLADSYQTARRRGHLLDATSRARDQIRMSSTGLVQWNSHLIVQNSMGDLFAQRFRIRPTETSDLDNSAFDGEPQKIAEAMTQWDDKLTELATTDAKPFYATDIVDLRPLAEVIARNVTNPNGVGGSGVVDLNAMETAEPQRRAPKWRQSTKRLNTYVDALAKSMLSVWDLPLDDADNLGIGIPAKTSVTAVRIANWLENSVANDDDPVAAKDLNVSQISPIRLSNSSEPNQTQLTATTQSQGQMPITSTQVDSPATAAGPKRAKKAARQSRVFVPGF